MSFNNNVLSQLLKLIPKFEFEQLANQSDGKRRNDALSCWSQFVSLLIEECGDDTNHGRVMCLFVAGVFKVSVQDNQEFA